MSASRQNPQFVRLNGYYVSDYCIRSMPDDFGDILSPRALKF